MSKGLRKELAKEERQKSRLVQFRVTEEKYEQLLVKVERQKTTISKLCRALAELYLKEKL